MERLDNSNARDYTGTAAEMATLKTAILAGEEPAGAGSTFWDKDNKIGYLWIDGDWEAVQ